MAMLDIIKKAALAAGDANSPVEVMMAEAVAVEPLRVYVDNRFELPGSFIAVLDHVGEIREQDRLVLLRGRGGNEFFVIGKVGNNGDANP